MLALLEAEGKLDVKKPAGHYLPQVKGSAWNTVSVEEALDMATGLDSTENDEPNVQRDYESGDGAGSGHAGRGGLPVAGKQYEN